METAHHMLIYGCTKPGSSKPIWNCGEMANAGHLADTAPACKEGTQVILRSPNIFYKYILDINEKNSFVCRSFMHGQEMLLN